MVNVSSACRFRKGTSAKNSVEKDAFRLKDLALNASFRSHTQEMSSLLLITLFYCTRQPKIHPLQRDAHNTALMKGMDRVHSMGHGCRRRTCVLLGTQSVQNGRRHKEDRQVPEQEVEMGWVHLGLWVELVPRVDW